MNKTGKNKEHSQAELLNKELQQFRKGQGLTYWKLKEAVQLKNVVARHIGLPEEELSAGQLHAYLLYEIEKLGNSPMTEALRQAFAIDSPDGSQTLTQRREDLALQLGRHPDTIKAYENQALKELSYRLGRTDSRGAVVAPVRWEVAPTEQPLPTHLKALKNAATESLTGLYSLGENGSKILQTLGRSTQPFLDVDYFCSLLPSDRGPQWYKFTINYRFKTAKTTFRLGASASPLVTGTLMATGIVDDIIQFDDGTDLSKELRSVLAEDWRLVAHDVQRNISKVLQFSELSKQDTKNLLDGFWQLEPDDCRILEVTVPDAFRGSEMIYEIRAVMDLGADGYAFWEAPSLMYLNTITIDLSGFSDQENPRFSVKPFLGNLFPTVAEAERRIFHLSVNSWITSGHGVAIIWR
jgi:hypothetical protein